VLSARSCCHAFDEESQDRPMLWLTHALQVSIVNYYSSEISAIKSRSMLTAESDLVEFTSLLCPGDM
jgi:hypothetical protein